MRWVRPHQKRAKLDAPEILKSEWESGDRNQIADMFSFCNFEKDTTPLLAPTAMKHNSQSLLPSTYSECVRQPSKR